MDITKFLGSFGDHAGDRITLPPNLSSPRGSRPTMSACGTRVIRGAALFLVAVGVTGKDRPDG